MFLKNCWHVAGWSPDFVAGEMMEMTIINAPPIIYRNQNHAQNDAPNDAPNELV